MTDEFRKRFREATEKCPKPYGSRLAVLPEEIEDVSAGGIIVVREHEEAPNTGVIVDMGAEVGYKEHVTPPYNVFNVGDRVWHGRYSGIAIDLNEGEGDELEVILLHEDEILAFRSADPADFDDDLPF